MIDTEIERKWLIDKFPDMGVFEEVTLYAWYLSTHPEVRIRKKDERYVLCVKGEGTLAREEFQSEVSTSFGKGLTEFIGKRPIEKYMRIYNWDGYKLECSLVDRGSVSEFMYAEIEFESAEEAQKFQPPPFLGKEVTYDNDMKMRNYWRRTRIEN